MPEPQVVKSKREQFMERIRGKYPDKEFADDEAYFGQINDDYDDYERRIGDFEEKEGKLRDMFATDHRAAQFLTQWRDGKDPVVALIEMYGDDFMEEMRDPEKQAEIAQASKDFAERVAKEKDYEEQYKKNLQETISMLDQLQADEGLSDDDIDDAMEFLVTIMKDGILGKFSADSIHMALKACRYERDMQQAETEGEVRGRNERIEEKLRKPRSGDGLAMLGGKSIGSQARDAPDLGAIDQFTGDDIWQRGGMRRKKYNN